MLAIFDSLGFSELMIVVVAAVLVFGKRLPEVAAQAGLQIGKFRRSLQDVKNETGIDNDIRKIQRDIQNAVPRDLSMGEMARIASVELEKRMKANEERKTAEASPDAHPAAPEVAPGPVPEAVYTRSPVLGAPDTSSAEPAQPHAAGASSADAPASEATHPTPGLTAGQD